MQTVPNQRVITINKEPTDKTHIYTVNNIEAINEAAFFLQSKAGFKLYIYLAKNQAKHNKPHILSSAAFTTWAGVGLTAYNTAFKELEDKGYLVKKDGSKTIYSFYDKSRHNLTRDDEIIIEYPKDEIAAGTEEPKEESKDFVF